VADVHATAPGSLEEAAGALVPYPVELEAVQDALTLLSFSGLEHELDPVLQLGAFGFGEMLVEA
jgi:hypothetical protein